MEFQKFPKIPRYKRNIIITEKLDGTNAQVAIEELPNQESAVDEAFGGNPTVLAMKHTEGKWYTLRAGSRNRWLTLHEDNYGFAKWAQENAYELIKLGPGRHYGEWWGQGIQRRYGLDHKRFSLFNTGRWLGNPDTPECCHVVPLLYVGEHHDYAIKGALELIVDGGSMAAPGFMNPEGIIVYHTAGKGLYKITLDGDEAKGQ